MSKMNTITGIDLGTNAIRIVVGEIDRDEIQIVAVGEAQSQGISKGTINDLEAVMSSVSEALEKAERMVGIPLSRAVVGVNGSHIKVIESEGVVAVSKASGEVDDSDIERAVDQSQAVATPPNYEIIHVIPRFYNLDNQTNIKDPVGMTGIKLEAHTQIILALSAQMKSLGKCIYRANIEVDGYVFSPLACAEVLLSSRQKELGVALVNLGAATTSVVVYEDSELLHAVVLPVGSDHITGDVAIGLRTSIETAEAIKLNQGQVDAAKVSKREEIDLAKYASEEMPRTMVSKKHIAEIIEARLEEILKMINDELKKIGKAEKLPAGIVLTGGGSKMKGLVDLAKTKLKLPVFLGGTSTIYTPIDKVKDPQFTTALGLVYYADKDEQKQYDIPGMSTVRNFMRSSVKRFKRFFPAKH